MNQWIYEQSRIAGSFDCESKGLYYEFSCRMQKGSVLRRLYALSGWDSVYVGIPDERGELFRRVKRKLFPGEVSCMIASDRGRSQWSPWRGELDGIMVEDAWIRREGEEILLALPPTEALRFPAWAPYFTSEEIEDQSRMLLRLTAEAKPVALETENGRDTNEEIDSDLIDFGLPSESVTFDGDSLGDHGEEAYCADL